MGAALRIAANEGSKGAMRLPTIDDAGGQPASAGQAKEPSNERGGRGGTLKGDANRIPMPMMLSPFM